MKTQENSIRNELIIVPFLQAALNSDHEISVTLLHRRACVKVLLFY